MYLAGQLSFQGIFSEALRFDGKSTTETSTKSVSVLEALTARRQIEMDRHEQMSIDSILEPGSSESLSLGLLCWDSLDNCRGMPYLKLKLQSSALRLCQQNQVWKSNNPSGILDSLLKLLSFQGQILAYDKQGVAGKSFNLEDNRPKLGWSWLVNVSLALEGSADFSGGLEGEGFR